MGNLKIEKINDISMSTGYLRNYGQITGGDFIAQCCEKAGRYRMFNTTSTYPPDAKIVSEGGSDYFVDTFLAENNTWVRLEARNVRNENIWERQCRNGQWFDWVLLPNNIQIQSKMDLKVDKSGTKQLSDENFTSSYKSSVDSLVTTNYFRGYFDTVAQIQALSNPKSGWFGIVIETKTIWYYNTEWKDLKNENMGDMQKAFYDSSGKMKNVYERSNHDGVQPISSISTLQAELDKKVSIANQIKIIDNTNSKSVVDALSANMGSELKNNFLDIISGARPINFPGVFAETGWCQIGNLLLNFGVTDLGVGYDNATVEVIFPKSYSSKCFMVVATPVANQTTNSGADTACAQTIDNTKFSLSHDYVKVTWATKVQWLAIGV